MASAMVQINVRIPPELHAKLIHEAATMGTVTNVVTVALQDYFNHKQGGKGK